MATASVAEKQRVRNKSKTNVRACALSPASKLTSGNLQGSEATVLERGTVSINREEGGQETEKKLNSSVKETKQISPRQEEKGNIEGKNFDKTKSQVKMVGQRQVEENDSGTSKQLNIRDGGNKQSAQPQKVEQQQQQQQQQQRQLIPSEHNQGFIDDPKTQVQQDQKTQISRDQKNARYEERDLLQEETFCRVKDQATSPMPVEFLQKKTPGPKLLPSLTSSSIVSTENSNVSAKQPLPHRKTSGKTTSGEVDAILARKISSTDISSSKERPFVTNKVIHPPPKAHIKSSSVVAPSVSSGSQRQETRKEVAIKEDTEPTNEKSAEVTHATWRDIGEVEALRRLKCRRIYAKDGQDKDVALFYKGGTFFALEAWCSHMGGPLFQGDIEDYKGSHHVMCPWHAYMFDLTTGRSEIGLEQKVFPVRVERGNVQIQHDSQLSIYPFL